MVDLRLTLEDADELESVAKCFTRRRAEILKCISKNGKNLEEISEEIKVNRSFLTETIRMFREAGIIKVEREGKSKIPRVAADRVVFEIVEKE
jgi:predicted transcriptional regulator